MMLLRRKVKVWCQCRLDGTRLWYYYCPCDKTSGHDADSRVVNQLTLSHINTWHPRPLA